MLNFEQELEKYMPILEVDRIENKIATEDMRDVMDLIKSQLPDRGIQSIGKKDDIDKEL